MSEGGAPLQQRQPCSAAASPTKPTQPTPPTLTDVVGGHVDDEERRLLALARLQLRLAGDEGKGKLGGGGRRQGGVEERGQRSGGEA